MKAFGSMDTETLVVRVGVAALVILVVVVLGFMFRGGRNMNDAGVVAREWMSDVRSERYAAAYEKLATSYRDQVGPETFRQAISENAFIRGMQDFQSYETEAGAKRVRIRGEIESIAGPAETTFHLISEPGPGGEAWRITGVVVSGQPVLPLPSADSRR